MRIPLSAEAPPSYRGTHVRIEYEARVHAAIDWWPDAHAAFELKVVPPVVESPPTEPGVYSSDPEGPRGGEPHVELSLASTWTRAGEIVSGAFALSNVGSNRYTDVRVGLRGVETLHHRTSAPHARDHVRYEIRLERGARPGGRDDPLHVPPARRRHAGVRELAAPGRQVRHQLPRLGVRDRRGVGWSGDMTLRIPLPRAARVAERGGRADPARAADGRLRPPARRVGGGRRGARPSATRRRACAGSSVRRSWSSAATTWARAASTSSRR
ncbi:MAG: hypothetical protein M5U28_55850 [Sandaracinaceae bacterium]|nr:hypothetical protein [Sandaracinaceae bacterium]